MIDSGPNSIVTGNETAKCRWCKSIKTLKEMAVAGWRGRAEFEYSGVCKDCMSGTEEEVAAREAAYLMEDEP